MTGAADGAAIGGAAGSTPTTSPATARSPTELSTSIGPHAASERPKPKYAKRSGKPKRPRATCSIGGSRGGAKRTPPRAPACAACCKRCSAVARAAARSTPGPPRSPSVSPQERCAAGQPAPRSPHRDGWRRYDRRRDASPPPNAAGAARPPTSVASAQGSQALRGGSKIWVSGEQGVGGYEQGYARDRRVATDISPSEIEAMLRAYEDGGDSGLRDWMTQFFDDKYVVRLGLRHHRRLRHRHPRMSPPK